MSVPPAPGNLNIPPPLNEPRLESWGELALYLKRDIRTLQRWEKHSALPVRRMRIGKQDQVYAYRSELNRWMLERQPKPEDDKINAEIDEKDEPNVSPQINTNGVARDRIETLVQSITASKPRIWKRVYLAIAIVAGVVVAILGIYNYPPAQIIHKPASKVFLFVRPFSSVSDDPQERQFVTGLTDDLITHLARLNPELLVVFAPTTSKELGTKSIEDLHKTLKAMFVLEGSVRRDQNQLRVEAALISAEDQKASWTKSYTDLPGNVLKFQDQISEDVTQEIRTVIPGFSNEVKRSSARKVDPVVYDAAQAGRRFWLDRDIRRSMLEYQNALHLDPHYAPALAGLASTYLLMGESPNDVMTADEAIPKARDAAQQALAIDSTLADADYVLANIAMSYDRNLAEAERLFKKAVAEDPSNVTAHEWYGYYLMVTNQLPEAEMEINQAWQLDPAAPLINSAVAEIKYYRRDYDGAIAQAKQTLDQHPGYLYALFWLGSAYREKKMYREAAEQFDLACKLSQNNPAMLWAYGHVLAVSGKTDAARDVLAQLMTMKQNRYVPSLYIAGMYAGLGDMKQTFHWLDQAYVEKNDRLIYLNVDPLADPLRSDPSFPVLMKRVGLP